MPDQSHESAPWTGPWEDGKTVLHGAPRSVPLDPNDPIVVAVQRIKEVVSG